MRDGPFFGLTAGAGLGLSIDLSFVTLRPELRYQLVNVNLQGFESQGLESVETAVEYTGDRLWLTMGLEWGD